MQTESEFRNAIAELQALYDERVAEREALERRIELIDQALSTLSAGEEALAGTKITLETIPDAFSWKGARRNKANEKCEGIAHDADALEWRLFSYENDIKAEKIKLKVQSGNLLSIISGIGDGIAAAQDGLKDLIRNALT